MDLNEFAKIVDGKILNLPRVRAESLATDTRIDLSGKAFLALKGESFDGHDYCMVARQKGAVVVIVHRTPTDLAVNDSKTGIILVKDTLLALQTWAQYKRSQFTGKVVALTGSNGKTSTKEFLATILRPYMSIHYSKGSFNNHWGLPFSLLEMPPAATVGIFEMGMNHYHEIERLCQIAKPNIVGVTSVGRAHIENFGSIENIAKAKNEIYENCSEGSIGIFNRDDPMTLRMHEQWLRRAPLKNALSFARLQDRPPVNKLRSESDPTVAFHLISSRLESLEFEGFIGGVFGRASAEVFGAHNLTNLMFAACAALACGLSPEKIWSSVQDCKTIWGRNQILRDLSGAQIVFDAYNANPDSVIALSQNISALGKNSGKKFALLGEMLEMGSEREHLHYEIGRAMGRLDLLGICFFGASDSSFASGLKDSGYTGKIWRAVEYDETIAQQVRAVLDSNSILFIKGSRGMKLERFLPPEFRIK